MERWYADNQVYFLTARCFGKYRAFSTEDACGVFWDRLEHYAKEAVFTPWVVSLLPNHYHLFLETPHGRVRKGIYARNSNERAMVAQFAISASGVVPMASALISASSASLSVAV